MPRNPLSPARVARAEADQARYSQNKVRASKAKYMRKWRAANPELAAAKNREYVAAHRARKKAEQADVVCGRYGMCAGEWFTTEGVARKLGISHKEALALIKGGAFGWTPRFGPRGYVVTAPNLARYLDAHKAKEAPLATP